MTQNQRYSRSFICGDLSSASATKVTPTSRIRTTRNDPHATSMMHNFAQLGQQQFGGGEDGAVGSGSLLTQTMHPDLLRSRLEVLTSRSNE